MRATGPPNLVRRLSGLMFSEAVALLAQSHLSAANYNKHYLDGKLLPQTILRIS
jgi:hypothetical protein